MTSCLVFSGPAPPQCARHHFLTFSHIQFLVGNLIFNVWDSEEEKENNERERRGKGLNPLKLLDVTPWDSGMY